MLLPTAYCPRCKRDALVHRTLPEDGDPMTAELQVRCVDCDTRLDRFGQEPELKLEALEALVRTGYTDLDRPPPIGRGGCFERSGCEGCPKIDTRPW